MYRSDRLLHASYLMVNLCHLLLRLEKDNDWDNVPFSAVFLMINSQL